VHDAYRRLVEQGWTDALRTLHPGERICTFWKDSLNAFARDAGLRIERPSPELRPTSLVVKKGSKTRAKFASLREAQSGYGSDPHSSNRWPWHENCRH
jgi:hypothetical protein